MLTTDCRNRGHQHLPAALQDGGAQDSPVSTALDLEDMHLDLCDASDEVNLPVDLVRGCVIYVGRIRDSRERHQGKGYRVCLLKDPEASETHCKIWRDPSGELFVQDLGSRNGTTVFPPGDSDGADTNGAALRLFENSKIKVGGTSLVVRKGCVTKGQGAAERPVLDSADVRSLERTGRSPPGGSLTPWPLLCWHARTAVVLVEMTVVERMEAEEGESPVVELQALFKSLLESLRSWAQLDAADSELLSFAIQALTRLVPVFRKRVKDFQHVLSLGVEKMLLLLPELSRAADSIQEAAVSLLAGLAGGCRPATCDQLVLTIIELCEADVTHEGVKALSSLPDRHEDGLGFLYWLSTSVLQGRKSRAMASCARVSELIIVLAQELDHEGRLPWWPAVAEYLRICAGSQGRCDAGQQVGDCLEAVFRRISIEVLGGRVRKPSPGCGVELFDGREGVVLQAQGQKAWVGCKASLRLLDMQKEVRYLQVPSRSHIGTETLEILLKNVAADFEAAGGAGIQDDQIRKLKALAEHAVAYDGFGGAMVDGSFGSSGAAEVAAILDRHQMLLPIIELALRADEHRDVRRAVCVLEECFVALEEARDTLLDGRGLPTKDACIEDDLCECSWGDVMLWRGCPDEEQLDGRVVNFRRFPTYRCSTPCKLGQMGYYEIEVLSSLRAPQFGFVSEEFSSYQHYSGEGVGDDADSWGVDGHRRKLWHDGPSDGFNGTWSKGDVVSLAVDLTTGQVSRCCALAVERL